MGSEERGGGSARPAAAGGTRGAAGGRAKTEVGTGVGMPRQEEEVVVVVDAPRGPELAEAVTPLAAIAAASGPLVPPLPTSVTADNVPLLLEFCIAPAPD